MHRLARNASFQTLSPSHHRPRESPTGPWLTAKGTLSRATAHGAQGGFGTQGLLRICRHTGYRLKRLLRSWTSRYSFRPLTLGSESQSPQESEAPWGSLPWGQALTRPTRAEEESLRGLTRWPWGGATHLQLQRLPEERAFVVGRVGPVVRLHHLLGVLALRPQDTTGEA